MKCVKKVLKTPKQVFLCSMVCIAFLVSVLGNVQRVDVDTTVYYSSMEIVGAHIASGDVLEQQFVLKEGDEGVAVLFCTYGNLVTAGTIDVQMLNEDGDILSNYSTPANKIADNKYYRFFVGDNIKHLEGEKLTLRLTFKDVDNQIIGVWASNSDKQNCTYTINGVEQGGDLVLRGVSQNAKLMYKDLRLYYLFALVLLIAHIANKTKWKQVKGKGLAVIDSWKRIDKRKIIIAFFLLVFSLIVATAIECILMQEKGYGNPYRWGLFFVVSGVISFSVVFKEYIWRYAHIYYFIVIMSIGMVSVFSLPISYNISWDDQVHYYRTAYMSWGGTDYISAVDEHMSWVQTSMHHGERENTTAIINSMKHENMIESIESMDIKYVAYIPASIALCMGRILGFTNYEVYLLGKLVNLFCYAACFAMAIYNFKGRGKLITAALGLIPVSLFVAISYSCDWWIIALSILGFSISIGEIQKKGYVSTRNMVASVSVVATGMLTKAVYFPMLFPLMLLRKERYEKAKRDRWIPFVGMLILLATFMLPIIFSGGGQGDSRGGDGVNSAGQIMFILRNIPEFLGILFVFFKEYLSLNSVQFYLGHMAYLGIVEYVEVIFVIICIATLIDNTDYMPMRHNNSIVRAGNLLGVFGAIVLVATALYISFTPVGYTTINGCQYRYLLPVLFPFLFFTGEYDFSVSEKFKTNFFLYEVISMMLIFLNSWYNLVIVQF